MSKDAEQLVEIARELHEAAGLTSSHARAMEKKARELNAQALQLRARADEAMILAAPDAPDDSGGWDFDGVRAAARRIGEFTVEQFTRTLGTKPIQTIGWIRRLVDEDLLVEGEDADGLRTYRYNPADDEDVPEPPAETNGNGHPSPFDDIETMVRRRSRSMPVPGTGKGGKLGSRFSDPNVAKLAKRIEEAGGQIEKGGSGHYRVYYDGRIVGSMASTPKLERDLANSEAQLKRAGLPL